MNSKEAELIKKYNIDIESLKKEQLKLAKTLVIEDSCDFSEVNLIAGIDSEFEGSNILSTVLVVDKEMNILEQAYSTGRMKFPYITGFRAYRELPAMLDSLDKLDEKPDVIFIKGHGISHPRLGIASHFSLSSNIPSIGVTESLMEETELRGEDILLNGKVVGKIFISKKGARPLYISPGNLISVDTALELTKKFMKYPHKLPEPLHLAGKYGKKMRKEVLSVGG